MHINHASFKFHPVGQGLFYSGRICKCFSNSPLEDYAYLADLIKENLASYHPTMEYPICECEEEFNFIYDIGSLNINKLSKQISDYITNLTNKGKLNIDLLVLSHLDKDHINGLEILLKLSKSITINTIILPYLFGAEQVLLTLKQAKIDAADNHQQPDWYYSFLENPSEYLKQFDVQNIIYLYGHNYETPPTLPDGEIPNDNLGDIINNSYPITNHEESTDENVYSTNDAPIRFFDWEFILFDSRSQISLDAHKEFLDKVKQIVGNYSDLPDLAKIILNNPNMLKQLKSAYKETAKNHSDFPKDHNEHSVCMYHMPLHHVFYSEPFHYNGYHRYNYQPVHGTILTGDYNLKDDTYMKLFSDHFNYKLFTTYTFSIPHHGAKSSNSKNAINLMANARYCVASHGIDSKFRHPDYKVIYDVKNSGKDFIHVHEENKGFTYTILTYSL